MNMNELRRDFNNHRGTYMITVLVTAVWLWQFFSTQGNPTLGINLLNAGALWNPSIIQNHEFWRLFTALFIHIGWTHFAMNTLTIFFIGRQVEQIFGTRNYLIVYVLSGIFGNAMVFWLAPNVLSAGASTSIFGTFAALAALGYFTKDRILRQIGQSYLVLIIVNLVLNLFDLAHVSIWSHVGGALGGIALALIFVPNQFASQLKMSTRITAAVVFLIALALFITLPFLV